MESATSGGGGGAACLLPAWVRRRRSVSSPPHPWARKNGRKKGEEEEEERRLRQQVANRRLLFISLPLPAWDQDRGMEKRNPAATACEFLCSCSKEEKEGERRTIPILETRKISALPNAPADCPPFLVERRGLNHLGVGASGSGPNAASTAAANAAAVEAGRHPPASITTMNVRLRLRLCLRRSSLGHTCFPLAAELAGEGSQFFPLTYVDCAEGGKRRGRFMEEEREITDCLKGGKGVGFLLLRVNDRRQKPCLFFHMLLLLLLLLS